MPIKILSVDDSRTIRRLVAKAFSPYDCTVCEAGNGEEGLAAAAKERPDLILLDVTMPVMDGVTMLTTLKANADLKAIPVIMLTAESGRDNVLQIARLGVRDYLVKPFKDEQLIEKAGRVVSLSKKAQPTLAPRPATAVAKPAAPAETTNFQELARRYGLPPVPDSVIRLTQIVARQDADIGEITRVISKDAALQERLLRLANPEASSPAAYTLQTVEEVLLRNGVGCALLLAMSTPLALALGKAFQTMLAMKLESLDLQKLPECTDSEFILGTIAFSGKAAGSVCLRLGVSSAKLIASRLLRLDPKTMGDTNEVNDAIGELLNIIAGNFRSNLCDAGLDCRLEPPTVAHSDQSGPSQSTPGALEQMAFRSGAILVFVDVSVNPWS
jgi:CheY-like chemotaxis protein/CheY-specific phosphatase CheX